MEKMTKAVDLNNRYIGVTMGEKSYNKIVTMSKDSKEKLSYSQACLKIMDEYIRENPDFTVNKMIPDEPHRNKQINLFVTPEAKKEYLRMAQNSGRTLSDFCYRLILLALNL